MDKIAKHDCTTGVVTVRDMTPEEQVAYDADMLRQETMAAQPKPISKLEELEARIAELEKR